MAPRRPRWPQLKNVADPAALRARLEELGVDLPVDDVVDPAPAGALASSWTTAAGTAPNRWAILPMEGWDATDDGRPTELVHRRWERFGASGAGLVWGGEAVAVHPDGRANPNQLCIGERSVEDLGALRATLDAGASAGGHPRPVVGLQLTHSGRFARPHGTSRPRTAYAHPVLDERVGADETSLLTDGELDELVARFVGGAAAAAAAGFDFVDVKSCHGYLLHELLTGVDRPGPFGGDLEGRSRLLRTVISAVRHAVPEVAVGVRLSIFDVVPWTAGADGVGVPDAPPGAPYRWAFGGDGGVDGIDLTETHALLDELESLGVAMLCATAGSPYYNPHVQRPAYFPPSDGYLAPEDPLVGVARMLGATRTLAQAHPGLPIVASGLSYLQDWIGHIAQPLVADGWAAAAGIGRMALSYPTMPADLLAGATVRRRQVCRTFSDCTTAPRNGLVSGCYPLDPHYKAMPERAVLAAIKRRVADGGAP